MAERQWTKGPRPIQNGTHILTLLAMAGKSADCRPGPVELGACTLRLKSGRRLISEWVRRNTVPLSVDAWLAEGPRSVLDRDNVDC